MRAVILTVAALVITLESEMATGLNIRTSLEITGDRDLFERVSKRLRKPRDFMKKVGVLGMSSAARRLPTVLKQDQDGARSGALMASINVDQSGGGSEHTVFRLGDLQVEVGTNLGYAAQVQEGGTILPRDAKALAIPLTPQLKRARLGPRDIDPNRKLLRFVHYTGSKPNVFGLLIDDGPDLTGRQRTRRGHTSYGPGPLFALAYWVTQVPRPFLFWDDDDSRVIREELLPLHLGL